MKKFIFILITILNILAQKIYSQTTGTLTLTYTPRSHGSGNYALATWIGFNTFNMRTINRFCDASTSNYLPTWANLAGCNIVGAGFDAMGSNCRINGATIGGTLNGYSTRTVTWDGIDNEGVNFNDSNTGISIQQTWGLGSTNTATRIFFFTKGPNVDDQTTGIPNDLNFTNISLIWQPTLSTSNFLALQAKVFPNPSNSGFFNIELKDSISKIAVSSILGKTVFSENTNLLSGDTKILDLSALSNGVYIVTLSNENAASNYKLVLSK